MRYILGIDQGGTKTAAALMNEEGAICGIGYEAGAYFPTQGTEHAVRIMDRAVDQAMKQAGITVKDIESVAAGITGVDWPGDDEIIRRELSERFAGREILVYNDCVTAMYGGTLKDRSAVICIGTGINAAIGKGNGEFWIFGDYLGEEMQGGTALAKLGIRQVFDAQMGIGRAEELTKLYLEFAGTNTVDELLQKYILDEEFQERLRLILPMMVALARTGDEAVNHLFQEFAWKLGDYIVAGLIKEDMLNGPIDIVLTGSVLKGKDNPLFLYLTQRIKEAVPDAVFLPARYEPVVGACVMGAMKRASFTEEMRGNLEKSAKEMLLLRD